MAVSTIVVPANRLTDIDAAYAAAEAWTDPAWRCAERWPLLPELAWARTVLTDPNRGVIVAREGSSGLGLIIFRPSDGRIMWLAAAPPRYVEVAGALIPACSAAAGARAWGYMERAEPRQLLLDAGVVIPRLDKPQWPTGTVVQAA